MNDFSSLFFLLKSLLTLRKYECPPKTSSPVPFRGYFLLKTGSSYCKHGSPYCKHGSSYCKKAPPSVNWAPPTVNTAPPTVDTASVVLGLLSETDHNVSRLIWIEDSVLTPAPVYEHTSCFQTAIFNIQETIPTKPNTQMTNQF